LEYEGPSGFLPLETQKIFCKNQYHVSLGYVIGNIFYLLHSQKKPVQKHSIQHRSELEENTEKEIFFVSEANHTNHLNSSHKYTEHTAEVFKSSGKKTKSPS